MNGQLIINGDQELRLTAQESAQVLDALSAQPYRMVAALIGKITSQLKDNGEKPNAQPENQGSS